MQAILLLELSLFVSLVNDWAINLGASIIQSVNFNGIVFRWKWNEYYQQLWPLFKNRCRLNASEASYAVGKHLRKYVWYRTDFHKFSSFYSIVCLIFIYFYFLGFEKRLLIFYDASHVYQMKWQALIFCMCKSKNCLLDSQCQWNTLFANLIQSVSSFYNLHKIISSQQRRLYLTGMFFQYPEIPSLLWGLTGTGIILRERAHLVVVEPSYEPGNYRWVLFYYNYMQRSVSVTNAGLK